MAFSMDTHHTPQASHRQRSGVLRVMHREYRRIYRKPRYVLILTVGIAIAFVFFATITREGVPQNLPVAVVDLDGTFLSRRLCHEINATQGVHVVAVYDNHTQARMSMQRGEIFAFYEIPKGTYNEVLQFHAPHFGLYSNLSYLLAGNLSYKQLATIGMLAAGAVQREVYRKKGYTDEQAMGLMMPVEIDTHLIGNPTSNYQMYLMTTLLPAIIAFIVLSHMSYIIGREMEERTLRGWMKKAGGNALHAILGKMIPYFFHYLLLLLIANVIMFGPMGFTFEGSWGLMVLNSALLIFAAQCAAVFITGLLPEGPFAMGVCAIYGAMSFSLSGFSFPIEAMPRPMTGISWLYPIRHYYLNYRDIAIFGNGIEHCWPHIAALCAFGLLALVGIYTFNRNLPKMMEGGQR